MDGQRRIRVAVFMGGRSGEHDVSLESGRAALENLPPERYDAYPVVVDRDGRWRFPRDGGGEPLAIGAALTRLARLAPDVAFVAMHGPEGEDGKFQSLFELIDLPYTGSDPYASSLAMNKPAAKRIYRTRQLPVAPDEVLDRDDWQWDRAAVVRAVRERFEPPWVLKTPKLGSSVGLDIVPEGGDLEGALAALFDLDREVMVEEFVRGRELTCGVLDGAVFGGLRPLPLVEITPVDEPFFNYEAKYTNGAAREVCPAPVDEAVTRRAQELGVLAHRALGCRGFSRTDFILSEDGELILLETNTIPGLTRTSLLPQAAGEAGISFPELVSGMVQEALARDGEPRG